MSHFSWIDGSIVGLYLLATMIAGLSVRKYVGKVEHFLVAGREMDVYLGVASLAATEFGIVTCMYTAELGYNHGFAGAIARRARGLGDALGRTDRVLHQAAARLGRDHDGRVVRKAVRPARPLVERRGDRAGRIAQHGNVSAAGRRVPGHRLRVQRALSGDRR